MIPGLKTLADTVHRDFISMSRSFIREPYLVNKIKEGKFTAIIKVFRNDLS
jgi:2,4-dienoyl-CoA reductase-like NADH-dependent reductase (Old Yellow Enzyme family)